MCLMNPLQQVKKCLSNQLSRGRWNETGILPRKLPDVQCNENDEQTIQHLIGCLQVEEPMSANEYLEIDNYLLGEIERIPTDEDVIETVTGIETPENRVKDTSSFAMKASIIF